MLIVKVIRTIKDSKGEDIKRPRNIIISRVWNVWLICPTIKNSKGDEIPWNTIKRIIDVWEDGLGDSNKSNTRVMCLTDENATKRLKSD